MMRYLKQRDNFNCGGIAVLNMMKWLGLPATYDGLGYIRKALDSEPDEGTDFQSFYKLLKCKTLRKFIDVRVNKDPVSSLDLARWCEKEDQSALVVFSRKGNSTWHFGFVPRFIKGIVSGEFEVVNWFHNVTTHRINRKLMLEHLVPKLEDSETYATVFFISKKNALTMH